MANTLKSKREKFTSENYGQEISALELSLVSPLSPGVEIGAPHLRERVKIGSIVLAKKEVIVLLLSAIICMLILVTHLFLQYNNNRTLQAINNYNASTSEIQKQTNQMNEEITKQFNYLEIKATASEEGMTLDKTRIRTVGNESE